MKPFATMALLVLNNSLVSAEMASQDNFVTQILTIVLLIHA
jgi:hypothetical protein